MISAQEALRQLAYWECLTDSEKNTLLTSSYIRTYHEGNSIFTAEECLGQAIVLSGKIRVYHLSKEGKEITLFTLSENETCILSSSGILPHLSFDTFVSAEADSVVLLIPHDCFQNLLKENIEVKVKVYEMALDKFCRVVWSMHQILFFGFDQRLATFLLNEVQRTKSDTLHLTHQQIATQVNSAREVVARMLKEFSKQGIVSCKRGTIRVLDMEKLKGMISE